MNLYLPKNLALILFCSTLTFVLSCGYTQELPASVSNELHKARISKHAIALSVYNLTDKKNVLSFNTKLPFSPASTMKLVTSSAALSILGPTFTWNTSAYIDGTLDHHTLQGNLIIQGNGDPKLVIENLWLFLNRIRAQGIHHIQGNVVLDHQAFEMDPHNPNLFDHDPQKPYQAGTNALLLNYKTLAFHIRPDKVRHIVHITTEPALYNHTIIPPTLSHERCEQWEKQLHIQFEASQTLFNGTFSDQCGAQTKYIHPHSINHTQYFSSVFRQMWQDMGGTLSGEIIDGTLPPDAQLLEEWRSPALSEILRDMNKYSNNVMAKQLLLTLAHQSSGSPATFQRGADIIRTWLTQNQFDTTHLVIENGSGLSRTEQISAHLMEQVLIHTFNTPTMPEFISSLPIAGLDGTMKHRLNTTSSIGHAHIKTGSLEEVRAIAGYVLSAQGKWYSIVFFVNHPHSADSQAAQDNLIQWVYEHSSKNDI